MASRDAVSMRLSIAQAPLTRRKLLTGGLALGALSLLAACGGSTTPTNAPAPSAAPSVAPAASSALPAAVASSAAASVAPSAAASAVPSAPASAAAAAATPTIAATRPAATPSAAGAASPTTGATRTVQTDNGAVTIPTNPQRIATVNFIAAWAAIDLGLTVLSTSNYGDNLPGEYASVWPSLADVGPSNEVSIEKVGALRPDLILGVNTPGYNAPYDRLSPLAPTVVFTAARSLANWDELAAKFAAALGRETQLAVLQGRYRDRVAGIKSTYAAQLGRNRWAFIQGEVGGKWRLIHDTAGSGKIGAQAGVQLLPAAVGRPETLTSFSNEQANQLAEADVIVAQADAQGKYDANTQAFLDQPVFKSLKAVTSGRVYPMTNFFPGSYAVALGLLDQIEDVLKKL